jgi:hypothetical protein
LRVRCVGLGWGGFEGVRWRRRFAFFSFLAVPLRSFVRYPRSFLNIVVIHISMLCCTSHHSAVLHLVSGTASHAKSEKDLSELNFSLY